MFFLTPERLFLSAVCGLQKAAVAQPERKGCWESALHSPLLWEGGQNHGRKGGIIKGIKRKLLEVKRVRC